MKPTDKVSRAVYGIHDKNPSLGRVPGDVCLLLAEEQRLRHQGGQFFLEKRLYRQVIVCHQVRR